ncbi:MAG: YCF48-related protein, partial [Nitrospiria bacterium]
LQDNWASDNLGLVNLVVRAMARGKIFLYIVTGDGIYRRQLGRHRWERVEGTLPADPLSIGVDETDQVYVGTAAGLYRSSDHGKRWENVGEIPAGPITGLTSGEEGILAIASKGIWAKSPGADGGWKEIIPNQGGPIQHAVWRKGKGILAATDQAIWEGNLEGEWRATAGEFLPGTTITSLAVSPSNNNLIYAGSDRGLFWSPDGGQEWHLARLYQGELFEKQVNQVLPTETRALWLATEEDGVILGIEKIGRSNWLKRWFK